MSQSRQLAAIMFTDIVGYTAIVQRSEQRGVDTRNRHRNAFKKITEKYQGEIIQYFGDGTLSIFSSALNAVKCAVELQAQYRIEPTIPVRIGIHSGDIVVTEDDVIGNAVNIASRIESLAIPGSVLVSDKIAREVRNHNEIILKELGYFHFKNDQNNRLIYAISDKDLTIPTRSDLLVKTKQPTKKNQILKVAQIAVAALLVGVLIISYYQYSNNNSDEIGIDQLFAEATNLFNKDKIKETYNTLSNAQLTIPRNHSLENIWAEVSIYINLESNPSRVEVFRKALGDTNENYEYLGETPLDSVSTYNDYSLWKLQSSNGDSTVFLANPRGLNGKTIRLDSTFSAMKMVYVKFDEWSFFDTGFLSTTENLIPYPSLDNFLIDKYEVTNEEFKEFYDAGGYKQKEWWDDSFLYHGQRISWNEAMEQFIDQSGVAGPSTWVGGTYLDGTENNPVGGVSWYEAKAYLKFRKKQLPSLYHWAYAASPALSCYITPNSNMGASFVEPVGQLSSIGKYGTYDMAGNIREWCLNSDESDSLRFILGGGYPDAPYRYPDPLTLPPFDRSPYNGIRGINLIENSDEYESKYGHKIHLSYRDYYLEKPASNSEFELYKRQFNYDSIPLNIQEQTVEFGFDYFTCRKIQINAAYNEEFLDIYLFLPENAKPPYKSVMYFPGIEAGYFRNLEQAIHFELRQFDYILRQGRAVIFPIMKGTFNRWDGFYTKGQESASYRDHVIMWGKDISRTLDYVNSQGDLFHQDNVAYLGYSWGAAMGLIFPAIESRIKCAILHAGGLYMSDIYPEVDQINYLSRITIPVLMLNGEFDHVFPLEYSQKPMFDFLGSSSKNKKHVVYQRGHFLPRNQVIKESLAWLQIHQGDVK